MSDDPYDMRVAAVSKLREELEALRAENARLKEALGLITTLAPTMEINPDDPIGMARNIVAEVSDNMARLRGRAE